MMSGEQNEDVMVASRRLEARQAWFPLRMLVTGVEYGGRTVRGIVLVRTINWDGRLAQERPCWEMTLRDGSLRYVVPKDDCSPELAATIFAEHMLGLHPVLSVGQLGEKEDW